MVFKYKIQKFYDISLYLGPYMCVYVWQIFLYALLYMILLEVR